MYGQAVSVLFAGIGLLPEYLIFCGYNALLFCGSGSPVSMPEPCQAGEGLSDAALKVHSQKNGQFFL